MISTTDAAASYWANAGSAEWMETYRASASAPYRTAVGDFLRHIAALTSVGTVLDVGCHCGPMTPTIMAAVPHAAITGIDINPSAIAFAKRQFTSHHWVEGPVLDWLAIYAGLGRKYDVGITSSCLSCMSPETFAVTLPFLCAVTRTLIVQEVTVTPRMGEGRTLGVGVAEWRYDYDRAFDSLGWSVRAKVWQQVETTRPSAVMLVTPKGR